MNISNLTVQNNILQDFTQVGVYGDTSNGTVSTGNTIAGGANAVSITGTIQPGIIWAGPYFQIGAEAIIPANRLTGHGYGGVIQLHFYLDDIFPRSIGRPISEWW